MARKVHPFFISTGKARRYRKKELRRQKTRFFSMIIARAGSYGYTKKAGAAQPIAK
ncbi:hypothetical protein [uncultured Alistipes sp.]|jgi:hypothetical protein|uniref:hypothetical protein n=1 Tax=uncultured Alistipes sp. TaxID=538949 RepID=UPI0025D1AAAB|nr:hypothetical protein [uncultured Alistipes sp.]